MPEASQPAVSAAARIVAITADETFEQLLRATFGRNAQIDLLIVTGAVGGTEEKVPVESATVLVIDVDAGRPDDIAALQNLARRVAGSVPMIVVTTGFSEFVARQLLQLRIADFLVKPVDPAELVRACNRAAQGAAPDNVKEAQIYTLLSCPPRAGSG